MGIFATRARSFPNGSAAGPEAVGELSDGLRLALPPRFEVVGEALASGSGSMDACSVVGRDLALDGVSLAETLDGLRMTYRLVCGSEPRFQAAQAISVAWSDATLGYLHQLSCEDPLTGLSSLAHVRTRLAELYRAPRRERGGTRDTHALVVVDLPSPDDAAGSGAGRSDVLSESLRASRLGDTARTVFSGTETIGRFGRARVVVVARRDDRLGQRISLLRRLLAELDGGRTARVWIEGLPDSDRAAASLLDELARL